MPGKELHPALSPPGWGCVLFCLLSQGGVDWSDPSWGMGWNLEPGRFGKTVNASSGLTHRLFCTGEIVRGLKCKISTDRMSNEWWSKTELRWEHHAMVSLPLQSATLLQIWISVGVLIRPTHGGDLIEWPGCAQLVQQPKTIWSELTWTADFVVLKVCCTAPRLYHYCHHVHSQQCE